MFRAENVSANYGQKQALKNINAEIKKGSFTGIIGKNGAGKSSLLKVLCGLLKTKSGSVYIDGKNINEIHKRDFAKIVSFMPQNVETDFPFTVRQMTMFGRYPHMNIFKTPQEKDFKAVNDALDFLDIKDIADRKINELSGGERQKVLIAQTIAQETDILIFDEPTAYLDMGAQHLILNFLKKINEKNFKTLIVTFHDLNAAGEFCSDIILMDDGCIIKTGDPFMVLKREIIEKTYGVKVCISKNPSSNKPYIIPI
jgi:iron complex transport system ATP-binding protein